MAGRSGWPIPAFVFLAVLATALAALVRDALPAFSYSLFALSLGGLVLALPLLSEPTLADRHQLIRYHKRGWCGSTHTPPPVSIADHAADAAALLDHLGLPRAHVAGHSSGALTFRA